MPKLKNVRPGEQPYERKQPKPQPVLQMDEREGAFSPAAHTTVLFKDLGTVMRMELDQCKAGDFVLLAMPSLEDQEIIEAMTRATRRGVLLLVLLQKEEWMRSDGNASEHHRSLRGDYNGIGLVDYDSVNRLLGQFYRVEGEWKFGETSNTLAVRCLGDDSRISDYLMRDRFVVFGTTFSMVLTKTSSPAALKVWVGAEDFSNCAKFESAVIIKDNTIAPRYAEHFATMFLNSEPLDWTSAVAQPEFTRVG